MATNLPPNVHVSKHPCLVAKLSKLRSRATSPREVNALVKEIALILGVEALGSVLTTSSGATDQTPLGYEYETQSITPENLSIVPILRSGLGMVEGDYLNFIVCISSLDELGTYSSSLSQAIQTILPESVPVHHLGLYREPSTLDPVEYYNNLPNHTPADADTKKLAIILDPVIATGGTCAAAIQTLREWGAQRIVVLSVIGAAPGVRRAAAEWDQVEVWLAGVDAELTNQGMLKPGVGDVGDRLFLTIGK